MVVAQKPLCRSVGIREGQVSGKSKTGLAPRCDELVRLVPTIIIEADAELIASQHAKDFSECRLHPSAISIVANFPTVARAVMSELRWMVSTRSMLPILSCRMASAQSPCSPVFGCASLMSCLLWSIFIVLLSCVSGFGSFTPSRRTSPDTERTQCGGIGQSRADAGSNASDRRDVCDWREWVQAEAWCVA